MMSKPFPPRNIGLTAVEVTTMLQNLGFNWLDVEFMLELAPQHSASGQVRYPLYHLQRFINRASWLAEEPLEEPRDEALPTAA